MHLRRNDLIPYDVATPGARGAVERWSSRRGLLLRVETRDGIIGQGEASPLPNYSPDTLDEARAALLGIDWARIPEPDPTEAARSSLRGLSDFFGGAPSSARFAAETAYLDILGQRAKRPLWSLLAKDGATPSPVPLSAMIGGADDDTVIDAARAECDRGIGTVKLKIAGPVLGPQRGVLEHVRDVIGERALRLDANRTLEPGSANHELELLAAIDPELVEEPVPSECLITLATPAVPLALDESLQDPIAWNEIAPHLARLRCVAVVLKPMAIGGIARALDVTERAVARGLDVTVSHLFDGPVAFAAYTHIALALASRSRASGLDRHTGLDAWPQVRPGFLHPTTLVAGDGPGLGMPMVTLP